MLALWICARLVHDATSGLSLPWCGAGHPTPIVPSRGYERDCHAVETGPAMLSSESAPILRLVLDGMVSLAAHAVASAQDRPTLPLPSPSPDPE
jgi:hypothetical protein